MAWTCTTGESCQSGSQVATVVYLDNGVERFMERFVTDGSARALKQAVRAWIAARDETTDALKCVPPGVSVTLEPDPAPIQPAPTADVVLARDFAEVWRRVVCLEEADRRKWGSVAQQTAVTNQLLTARTDAATLYAQKPSVCIPLMGRS